jgi:hypothetical protein
MENEPKVASLLEARTKKQSLTRKTYLDSEQRIKELEEDMLRMIEMCLYLEAEMNYNKKIMNKLLRLLQEDASASSVVSSSSSPPNRFPFSSKCFCASGTPF